LNSTSIPEDQAGQKIQSIDLKKVKGFLIASITRTLESEPISPDQRKKLAYQHLTKIYSQTHLKLSKPTREQLFREVLDELLGFGPVQSLIDDPNVSQVMVNGSRRVFMERNGKLIRAEAAFDDDGHVMRIIERIFTQEGIQIDADHPIAEADLENGSHINAVIPPMAIDGPSFTIRKMEHDQSVQDLLQSGALTETTVEFLRACVAARLNIIVSGGVDTGKTTLLNILSSFIPDDDRVITIEGENRLLFQQENILRLGTKPDPDSATRAISTRELVHNSLRLRPDRIVISRLTGSEAFELVQAMSSGYDGIITTLLASNPMEAVSRLEKLSLIAGGDWSIRAVREQIVSGVDLIIQLKLHRGGFRRLTQICEIVGMEGETVVLSDIFKFEQSGLGADGEILGELIPTGVRPLFSSRLEKVGFKLKPDVFGVNIVEMLTQGLSREHRKPVNTGEV
jgi:pilus assembly protein CpaF